MRIAVRACALLVLSSILGCGGAHAQAERIVEDNLRLLDQYADALESIGKVPDASKTRELNERIAKIRADLKANEQSLKAFPMQVVEEINGRHKAETDRIQQRIRDSFKPYRDKMPNLKKGLTPG
jgi:hypothetical protein